MVANVPDYSTPNVVQATFALLLEHTNRVGHHDATVHAGRWAASPDFCYWEGELVELAGLTLGVVGYGRIGRAVAAVGRAFGMRVIHHRRQAGEIGAHRGSKRVARIGARKVQAGEFEQPVAAA